MIIDLKRSCIIILIMKNFPFTRNYKILLITSLLCIIPSFILTAGGKKETDIEQIVLSDNPDSIKSALKKNIDLVNYENPVTKDNLLFTALRNNCSKETVSMLLKYGVSPAHKNLNDEIPFMYACKNSSEEIVDLMLNAESSFAWQKKSLALKKDKNGFTAFDYAQNRPEIISLLERQTKYEYTKIKEEENAAQIAKAEEEIKLAEQVRKEAEQKAKEELESSLEETAAAFDQTEETIADEVPLKYQPIYLFDENDNQILFEEEEPIVENTAFSTKDINIVDAQGRTSLMKAAAENNIILIHQLIQAGANVNLSDNDGWTAAMFSVRYGGTDLPLRIFKDKGADLRHANKLGISTLQIAARYNENPGVFAMLLKDRLPSETDVRSAFITSINSGKTPEVLEEFMKLQMPLNQFYFSGMTPLMFAAKNTNNSRVIDFLIKNGAEINIRSKEGKTAFDYASENKRLKHDSIYWALNTNGAKQ